MNTIVFISCVSKKLPRSAPAGELYVSDLFTKALAYAKSLRPHKIFILSAKYGLLELDQVIEPYEQTLNTMPSAEVKQWAARVAAQLQGKVDFANDEAVFLAGERYRKHLMPLFAHAEAPLKGMGIGKQLQYLKHATK